MGKKRFRENRVHDNFRRDMTYGKFGRYDWTQFIPVRYFSMSNLLPMHWQTPSVYHCLQNHSGYDSNKFIRQSKICMTQSKLMLSDSDYVTQTGLSKSKHQNLIRWGSYCEVSVSCKVVQRMYIGNNSALCLGFPSHRTWVDNGSSN